MLAQANQFTGVLPYYSNLWKTVIIICNVKMSKLRPKGIFVKGVKNEPVKDNVLR